MRVILSLMLSGAVTGLSLLGAIVMAKAETKQKYERPQYEVVTRLGKQIEIRHYGRRIVAQVEVASNDDKALNEGFHILAKYIFGENQSQLKIKMTAPVTAQPVKLSMIPPVTALIADKATKVSFFMPSQYSMQDLPRARDERVEMIELPERQFAAIRFSGLSSASSFREHENKLIEVLKERDIKVTGTPFRAYYNPPFTPPFMRRNEVLVEIAE